MARKKLDQVSPEDGIHPTMNGTAETATPETAESVAEAAVAVKRAKSPRETFYLVMGTTKDGTCIDVLGHFPTGNQARKALAMMGMAVARGYGSVQVIQCRDRTNV